MNGTALLLIDIQDSFRMGGRWMRRGNRDFEANVSRLLETWREARRPLFFILPEGNVTADQFLNRP